MTKARSPAERPGSLLFWPLVLTAVVLGARLTGELLDLDPVLFSKEAGGPGSLVGIVWLIPLFGAVFGWIMTGRRSAPDRPGLAVILYVFALVVIGGGVLGLVGASGLEYPLVFVALAGASVVSLLVSWRAWPELFGVLFRYGLFARLLVVALTAVLMFLDLGTHFEKVNPKSSLVELDRLDQGIALCAFQILAWVPFTVALGGIFGAFASMVRGRRRDDRVDD